ncbi:hypothetical protein BH09SUM1_BH09SUM1_19410 [soil metagenome]
MHDPDQTGIVSANDILRHYWSRRWLIILVPIVVMVATYLYIVFNVENIYQSQAMLMIRTVPSSLREGPQFKDIDPPVYEDFLRNDEMVVDVLKAAAVKYPENAYFRAPLERIRSSFKVKTILTRDTSVQATYSPVIILTGQANSPEGAKFLMDEWVRLAVERFGKLRSSEAGAIEAATQAKYDALSKEATETSREVSELEFKLDQLNKILDINIGILGNPAKNTIKVSGASGSQNDNAYGTSDPGLLAERVRLELQASEDGASTTPDSQERAKGVSARLKKVDELKGQVLTEIDTLTKQRVAISVRLESLRDEQVSIREKMSQMRAVITISAPDATLVPDPNNPDVSGDFRLVARPQLPQYRTFPQRTVIALGVTVAVSMLMLMLLAAELYMRRAIAPSR